jgi:hypothetical protein
MARADGSSTMDTMARRNDETFQGIYHRGHRLIVPSGHRPIGVVVVAFSGKRSEMRG